MVKFIYCVPQVTLEPNALPSSQVAHGSGIFGTRLVSTTTRLCPSSSLGRVDEFPNPQR